MKKALAAALCALLCLCILCSCALVEMGVESGESRKDSESSAPEVQSFAGSSEERSSVPVSRAEISVGEESRSLPSCAPVYPESYEERVAHYSAIDIGSDENDGYFGNSLFIGHSVMLHFKNYVLSKRDSISDFLGGADFFAAASFSLYNNAHQKATDTDCTLPSFRGEKLNITQAVGKTGAKTVFLSLMAMNDIALYKDGTTGVNETFALFKKLTDELKSAYPGLNIAVLGSTYLHKSANGMKKLNNGTIYALNALVLDYCNEIGLDFVNVADVLIDNGGCLGTEFCSDVGAAVACHLNECAYKAWTEILRDYASKKLAGVWSNPTALKNPDKF